MTEPASTGATPGQVPGRQSGELARAWFAVGVVVLVAVGIALRILFVVVWTYGKPLQEGDPGFYQRTAAQLSQGHGYAFPLFGAGHPVPTALHPPVFSLVLAALDVVGLESGNAHRIALAFIASGAIVAMALLGRRLAGPVVGLIAAGIAAVSPIWVQPGGRLLSESVYLVIIPIVMLAALRCIDRPSGWRFVVLGLAIGVATLTRSEALLLTILLGLPLLVVASRPWSERVRLGLALLAGVALIVGPWVIRNDIQLGALTLSTNSGTTVVGAYSQRTFDPNSPLYGSFDNSAQFGAAGFLFAFGHPPDHAKKWTEVTMSRSLSSIGKTFARQHLSDLPGVVLAREGRLWGLYSSGSQLRFDVSVNDGVWIVQEAGQYFNWILIPFAVGGGIVLYRRSRRDLIIVLAPVVAAALTAALAFGSTRYRTVAEPSLVLLAAIGTWWLAAGLIHARGLHRTEDEGTASRQGARRGPRLPEPGQTVAKAPVLHGSPIGGRSGLNEPAAAGGQGFTRLGVHRASESSRPSINWLISRFRMSNRAAADDPFDWSVPVEGAWAVRQANRYRPASISRW